MRHFGRRMGENILKPSKFVCLFMLLAFIFICLTLSRSGSRANISCVHGNWQIVNHINDLSSVDSSAGEMTLEISAIFIAVFFFVQTEFRANAPDRFCKIDRTPKFRHQMARSRIPDANRTNVRKSIEL